MSVESIVWMTSHRYNWNFIHEQVLKVKNIRISEANSLRNKKNNDPCRNLSCLGGAPAKWLVNWSLGLQSWDKSALLALLRTCQMQKQFHPPHPHKCWKLALEISPDFQHCHCIGWGRGWGQRVLQVLSPWDIYMYLMSQGLLSMIVTVLVQLALTGHAVIVFTVYFWTRPLNSHSASISPPRYINRLWQSWC